MDSSDDETNDPCLDLLTKPLGNKPLRKYKMPVPFSMKNKRPVDDKMMNPPSMISEDYICYEGDTTTLGKSDLLLNSLTISKHSSRSATPTGKHASKEVGHWYDQYVREEERLYIRQREEDSKTGVDTLSIPGTLSAIETNTISTSTMTPLNNGGNVSRNSNIRSLFSTSSMKSIRNESDLMKRYNFNVRDEELDLPIGRNRDKIMDMIVNNQVTIIHGYTGSGKTTQVPQFILDHHAERNKHVNIIVTQPRKIAAQSVARRVCQERNWQLGGLVGYVVGLDKMHASQDTKLLFCTTGVLKKMLISKKQANDWTHIIVDEVHEREEDVDFILMLLRRLINTNSRNVRLILMSATINVKSFKDYFSLGQTNPPEIFELQDHNPHHVGINYLEDLCNNKEIRDTITDWKGLYQLDLQTPHLSEEAISLAGLCISKFDDYEKNKKVKEKAAVLVFLPGENEIKQVKREFEKLNKKDWWILPLHSKIPWEETKLVFQKHPEGFRKIILSTNIAESSLTISDVDYVIDFCLTKLVTADPETNYFSLRLSWTDKNSCDQRKGRAGRLRTGKCFRMVQKSFYERYLPNQGTPEILRAPLDKVILDTKMLNFAPPLEILALTMAPPKKSDIMKNVMILKEMGALLPTVNSISDPIITLEDGDLTVLGKLAGSLPVDVRLGKFIIIGQLFDVLDECVIIAAGLSNKTIFASSFEKHIEAFADRLYWSNGSSSDCIAVLMAYKTWKLKCQKNHFRGTSLGDSRKKEENWCSNRHLQLKQLKEMDLKVMEIYDTLKTRCKIEPLLLPNREDRQQNLKQGTGDHYSLKEDQYIRIMCAIFGAFYPNYFLRSHIERDPNTIAKMLHGRDAGTTLYLTGFPQSQLENCILYEEQIKHIFQGTGCNKENMEVEFVSGQYLKGEGFIKVLITFLPESQDLYRELETHNKDYAVGLYGNIRISPYIYTSMKLRNMPKEFLRLNLYNDTEAHKRKVALKQRLTKESEFKKTSAKTIGIVKPPPPEQKMVDFYVSHVTTPGSFWVNYIPEKEEESEQLLLKNVILDVMQLTSSGYSGLRAKNPKLGHVYLAPYEHGNYYRARIDQKNENNQTVTVFFIDFGNVKIGINYTDLLDFYDLAINSTKKNSSLFNTPAMAMECSLAKTKPNPMRLLSSDDTWDAEVNDKFKEYLMEQVPVDGEMPCVYAEIFSIINRRGKNGPLLNVILFPTNDTAEQSFANSTFTDGYGFIKAPGFRFVESLNYRLQQERDTRGRRLALMAEEKHVSQTNHEDRSRIQIESTFSDRSNTFITDIDTTYDSRQKQDLEAETGDKVLDSYFFGNEEDSRSLTTFKSNKSAVLHAELRGPIHPLEFTLQAVHRMGRRKNVRVEPDSVNSILIDKSLPDEKHDQWLVAHEVSVNASSSNLLLRSTNFMPNRAGLGYILAMIFSPAVELRPKANCNHYTGCLVGMGSRNRIDDQQQFLSNEITTEEKIPYYPEHDMELTFDVKITNEDIDNINELRYTISNALTVPFKNTSTGEGQLNSKSTRSKEDVARLIIRKHLVEDQDKISNLLDQLLGKHVREAIPKESFIHAHHWLEPPPKGFSEWKKPLLQNEKDLIFKMIPYTNMIEEEDTQESTSSLFKTMSEGESTSDRHQYLRSLENFSQNDRRDQSSYKAKDFIEPKNRRKSFHRLKIGGVHINN